MELLKRTMRPDGFNLGINMGLVAGAGVADHIHLHIVPRWNGDTNFMPVLSDTQSDLGAPAGHLWEAERDAGGDEMMLELTIIKFPRSDKPLHH